MTLIYPYALLDRVPMLAGMTGLAGEAVEVQQSGSWILAAGRVGERPTSAETQWRAHDRVVRQLFDLAGALLPFRFGSVVETMEQLVLRLDHHERELREALALVQDGEQMTLRVFGERSEPAPIEPEVAAVAKDAGPGTRYLHARLRAQTVAGLEPLKLETAPYVRAARIERHDRPPLLASVYHLVARAARGDYLTAAQAAAARMAPMRVSISGPWPAYAFVPEVLS